MIYGVRAGSLRSRVVIETNTATPPAEQWELWAVRTVNIEPLRGKEAERAKAIYGETSHLVKMRFIRGLTTLHRLCFEGRIFEITAIIDTEERRREFQVYCTETPTYRADGSREMRFYEFAAGGIKASGTT
jgi:SPP1 family predicted phage head-tail adaptor